MELDETTLPPPPPPVGPAPPVRDVARSGPPSMSRQATTALVVGIVSIVFFGIILGPLAIYLANKAQQGIDESGGRLTGSWRAAAGRVLGIIGLVLWVTVFVFNLAVRS